MPGICDGGTCMNTDGGVICDCPEGFVLSSNGMKCIDTRQDHCYDKFLSGQYNIILVDQTIKTSAVMYLPLTFFAPVIKFVVLK